MSNALLILNQFPSQNANPNAALVFIDVNGDGSLYSMSLDLNPANTYPSNPASITAKSAIQASLTGAVSLLSSTALVDLNSATPTLLYTCPAGVSTVVTRFVFRNASTSLTTASWSIGWNGPATFNDVLSTATRTELTGNTLYSSIAPKVGAAVGTAAGTLKLLANILQGAAATITVDVFGYLF